MLTLDRSDGHGRVLLLENIHPDAATRLSKAGYQVDTRSGALTEDELVAAVGDVQILGIRSGTHVTGRVLDAAPGLLAIGAFCIGINQIDLAAASERGIAVFNAPFSNTRSVVELALAEIIALTRRLTDKNRADARGPLGQVRDGQPRGARAPPGHRRLRQHRRAALGAGRGLGMTVYFYDTADKLALGNARRCGTLEELLEISDVVTLHVDGRPGNSGLFGEAEFAAMRPGSLFLNLSRGFVVDHAALRRNIESGHLAGAAVDVFPQEPRSRGEEFVSELRGLPNVILTPHVGGSTEEAQQDIGEFVAGKLHDYVNCGTTSLSVNLPRVALPHTAGHAPAGAPAPQRPRRAGQRSTSCSPSMASNIEGQLLGTRDELGYVLTDVGTEYPGDMLASLRSLDVTIRLRTVRPS